MLWMLDGWMAATSSHQVVAGGKSKVAAFCVSHFDAATYAATPLCLLSCYAPVQVPLPIPHPNNFARCRGVSFAFPLRAPSCRQLPSHASTPCVRLPPPCRFVFFAFPLLRKARGIQKVLDDAPQPGARGLIKDVLKLTWGEHLPNQEGHGCTKLERTSWKDGSCLHLG